MLELPSTCDLFVFIVSLYALWNHRVISIVTERFVTFEPYILLLIPRTSMWIKRRKAERTSSASWLVIICVITY
jgi:hypothetical protein